MFLFTKKRKEYTPQEQVYFCHDLWNNILSYNTCPACNKCIEKKEVFDIKSKVWTWIRNRFELEPIPEPKIYKEVYKTNFKLFKQIWMWDREQKYPIQQIILCDDCNPKKRLRKEEEERKKEECRRKRRGQKKRRRRVNWKAEPGHWI